MKVAIAILFLNLCTNAALAQPSRTKDSDDLRSLFTCADGIADHNFGSKGSENNLIRWYKEISEDTPSILVAVSEYLPGKSDEDNSLITVSDNRIIRTKAIVYSRDKKGLRQGALVSLHLEDQTAPDIGTRFTLIMSASRQPGVFQTLPDSDPNYLQPADLNAPRTEIRAEPTLADKSATATVDFFKESLRRRILETIEGFRKRAIMLKDRPALMDFDVKYIQQGICKCQMLFENETNALRHAMTDPKSPLEIFDNTTRGFFILKREHLNCDMM